MKLSKLRAEQSAVWTTKNGVQVELTVSEVDAKLVLTNDHMVSFDEMRRDRIEAIISVDDLLEVAYTVRNMLEALGVLAEEALHVSYPIAEGRVDPDELKRFVARFKDAPMRPIVFQNSQGCSPYAADSPNDDEWEPESAPEGIDG